MKDFLLSIVVLGMTFGLQAQAVAGEAELRLPTLNNHYDLFGSTFTGGELLAWGMVICALGALFGLIEFLQLKRLPAHPSMVDVSNLIYETCKTYLWRQARFMVFLWALLAGIIVLYFGVLEHKGVTKVSVDMTRAEASLEAEATTPLEVMEGAVHGQVILSGARGVLARVPLLGKRAL
jgi:K(+)-stimulated pyrophosphate-energized sodium pump